MRLLNWLAAQISMEMLPKYTGHTVQCHRINTRIQKTIASSRDHRFGGVVVVNVISGGGGGDGSCQPVYIITSIARANSAGIPISDKPHQMQEVICNKPFSSREIYCCWLFSIQIRHNIQICRFTHGGTKIR